MYDLVVMNAEDSLLFQWEYEVIDNGEGWSNSEVEGTGAWSFAGVIAIKITQTRSRRADERGSDRRWRWGDWSSWETVTKELKMTRNENTYKPTAGFDGRIRELSVVE